MQDRERGVVWEEAIIFLPKGVRMVFLSATLSNATEFAGWVCNLHKQPCHVVYTDFRPTPLQHYAFPSGGSGLYLVSSTLASHTNACSYSTVTYSPVAYPLSNATEFAGWVCNLHKQICHLVYTDFRATLLLHYAFLSGGSGLYLVSSMLASHSHPCACVWPCHLQPCPMPLFAG